MQRNTFWILVGIIIVAALAVWIDLPTNPGIHLQLGGLKIDRDIRILEGLDLRGGMQVMLEADVPPGQNVDAGTLEAAKWVVENRVNGLGVTEPVIQLQTDQKRIIVELPGVTDTERAIHTFGQTGLLEFIDTGPTYLPPGTEVTTSLGGPQGAVNPSASSTPAAPSTPAASAAQTPGSTPNASPTPAASATPAPTPATSSGQPQPPAKVYNTIVQGKDLKSADVGFDEYGRPEIDFQFNDAGAKAFGDFTSSHVGQYMAIVLDKKVISCPQIQSPITQGKGRITGTFSLTEAQDIVLQLKYGALPVPLKVVQSQTVGPTLGEDSINKSLIAGIVGFVAVGLFMLIQYRLPGLLANIALAIYAAVVFALFKTIPVTLTLAGIAGFILSIGMAVDANILIFERMKEELRAGKTLGAAVEAGFSRAWTSIRDSNMSTLITCAILFWFGSTFGASIIKGFALTLAIGVIVSLFTAVIVSHTFLRLLVNVPAVREQGWLGLAVRPAES